MGYAGDTAAHEGQLWRDAGATPANYGSFSPSSSYGALPLAFISVSSVLFGVLLGAVLAAALAIWARRLIGGYTGDVLGAIEQVFEIGFLLGVAAIIR